MNRPSAVSIKLRFPEFVDTDDSAIEFAIDEAMRMVDDTWMEGDRALAASLLAAHFISVAASSAGVDGRVVTSETIGPISVSYATGSAASGGQSSFLDSTAYGKRFQAILDRNVRGPMTII